MARSLSDPWTTNHHTVLLLANVLVLRLTLSVRLLEIVAETAPDEQVLMVPQIFLVPMTLTLDLVTMELLAVLLTDFLEVGK